jgi:hypothetical protein
MAKKDTEIGNLLLSECCLVAKFLTSQVERSIDHNQFSKDANVLIAWACSTFYTHLSVGLRMYQE